MNIYSEHLFGDIRLTFFLDEHGHMGMAATPLSHPLPEDLKAFAPESLVQVHARGDSLPNGYGSGMTLAATRGTDRFRFVSQSREGDTLTTVLSDGAGQKLVHRAAWQPGWQALSVSVRFENGSAAPVTLDLLSSLNLCGISPFSPGDSAGCLFLHRARSAWSAEGRLQTESIEEAMLERSWTGHALRVVKFGQVGSMPVRGYFPFAAVEDRSAGVTWAMQLACPSSWQMEIRRKDDCLSMMASLADGDFGHWAKTLLPGESLETPEAFLAVGAGGVDEVSQRLLTIQRSRMPRPDAPLPVLFNEYCTTWGNPSHENLEKIAAALDGRGVDYLVIDAGWYGRPGGAWFDCGGDWVPEEQFLFPRGLKGTADMIRGHGLRPGLWFEPETCAAGSAVFRQEDMLLKRFGAVIDTDNRRFLDMRLDSVRAYLRERVIGLLKEKGFEYIKIDYNDCIGVGCDDPDSLGEGLRRNMLGTLDFFREIRDSVPGILIENCASGGHRLEPSLMAVSDMASFSDAHECPEIPVIAASLHRLICPAQSQIWAVLRASDSLRRLNYSLVSTFLGVMCLSGDIFSLSPEQWEKVGEGIAFFRAAGPVIRDGVSAFFGGVSASWRHPEGWQAVVRTCGAETLAVVHTFGGAFPSEISLPVRAGRIRRAMCSENNHIALEKDLLKIGLKAPFEAVAVLLTE